MSVQDLDGTPGKLSDRADAPIFDSGDGARLAAELPTQRPSRQFAAELTEQFLSEGSRPSLPAAPSRGVQRGKKGVVVPLLAAIALSSAAAAAGWGILQAQQAAAVTAVPESPPRKDYELQKSPALVSGQARSHPEISRVEPPPAPQAPTEPPRAETPPPEATAPETPPGPARMPPCHCTAGAAICSCFD